MREDIKEAIDYLETVRNRWSFRGATSTSVMLWRVQELLRDLNGELTCISEEAPKRAMLDTEADLYDDNQIEDYFHDCDSAEGDECDNCALSDGCKGYYDGCYDAVNSNYES
ncbi:hypothetical protein SDC9_57792 [bioreactor metagenome]|uniref:Uncharacterized protein n=1 Tax=bioreactor metagenome TaxID=1076179 RepID=A0A644X6K4_9ZZZZ